MMASTASDASCGSAKSALAEIPKRIGLLRDGAYTELKNFIVFGEAEPGCFLSERQVAALLGMSKTPIRAAFGRLESEGLVSIIPHLGVVVKELSAQEVADHFDLRSALEPFVVRHIAGHLNDAQVQAIEANLVAQEECAQAGEISRSVRLDGEYHILLSGCLGNLEIHRVMLQIQDRTFRIIRRVLQGYPERLHTNHPEHRAIFQAILAGDGDAAAAHMEVHLENGQKFLTGTRLGRLGSTSQEAASVR